MDLNKFNELRTMLHFLQEAEKQVKAELQPLENEILEGMTDKKFGTKNFNVMIIEPSKREAVDKELVRKLLTEEQFLSVLKVTDVKASLRCSPNMLEMAKYGIDLKSYLKAELGLNSGLGGKI